MQTSRHYLMGVNMSKILLFAGTTEGRLIWNYCNELHLPVTACVATEYGEFLLESTPLSEVLTGRLDKNEMKKIIGEGDFSLCLDATHPYAKDATENIRNACLESKLTYIRVIRDEIETSDIISVDSMEEVVSYLNMNEGKVLITTGSKEIGILTKIKDYKNRLYVRILPDVEGLKHCLREGFSPSHIICMQGPFTTEFNTATLKQVEASYLVTKEGGCFGGFMEKVDAARNLGAKVIVVKRPSKEEGLTLTEIFQLLKEGK